MRCLKYFLTVIVDCGLVLVVDLVEILCPVSIILAKQDLQLSVLQLEAAKIVLLLAGEEAVRIRIRLQIGLDNQFDHLNFVMDLGHLGVYFALESLEASDFSVCFVNQFFWNFLAFILHPNWFVWLLGTIALHI